MLAAVIQEEQYASVHAPWPAMEIPALAGRIHVAKNELGNIFASQRCENQWRILVLSIESSLILLPKTVSVTLRLDTMVTFRQAVKHLKNNRTFSLPIFKAQNILKPMLNSI